MPVGLLTSAQGQRRAMGLASSAAMEAAGVDFAAVVALATDVVARKEACPAIKNGHRG